MRIMHALAAGLAAIATTACEQPTGKDHYPTADAPRPPAGSNEMLRAPVSAMPGVEVIISDVVIPPGATVPRHYHPGEEFLYVIEGSAVHVEEGKPDRVLKAGDSYVIPPRAVHSPYGGPEGARAIVFRVHIAGEPERYLVEEGETAPEPETNQPEPAQPD